MYLRSAFYKNEGPITNLEIQFPFSDNDFPKPIVFVGENGSGKSTVLSNIVDSFYEIAGIAFKNAREQNIGNEYQYFKAISPTEIKIGSNYMISYLSYTGESSFCYINKSGDISFEEVKEQLHLPDTCRWEQLENKKHCTANKKMAENEWASNVICYFGPDRYEKPFWMGSKYYESNKYEHPTIQNRWAGELINPITVKNVTSSNLQWMLDVIADSRVDIIARADGTVSAERVNLSELTLLRQARSNIETIMSKIIGEDVYFSLNYRSSYGSRFKILRKSDDQAICPTLDSLSTGQIALFNLFATIVKYADANDINNSIHLSEIQGIVAIDEIELHLHTRLQKEVLPSLMKLFPKIQFIITSHAPLFLLGMKEQYGEEGFEVWELPEGNRIDVEKFSEFNTAYDYFKQTELYQADVVRMKKVLDKKNTTVIVTEGSTDWKHLQAAWNSICRDERYKERFSNLKFEILEYAPTNSDEQVPLKIDMGNTMIEKICESYSKLPHETKYIFIVDNDDRRVSNKMTSEELPFKDWGNNVFSFALPIPDSRKDTPQICIEHLYSDDEIRTEYRDLGIARRLFLGYEFDDRGISVELDKYCEKKASCGEGRINIIDGSSGERVTSIKNENGINYALSKSSFANLVLQGKEPFNNFNFDNFVPIFETIQIINEM